MILRIDSEIELKQFEMELAELFFESIHANSTPTDFFCSGMPAKYSAMEKVVARLKDAVSNKYDIDGTPDFFIIYQNKIAGVFEFHPIMTEAHLEIGFWLFPNYRGLRILTRIFPIMIGYAAKHFPSRQLIATTAVNNDSAQKLLSRMGFEKTGTTTEVDRKTGESEDQFIFELQCQLGP